MTERPVEVGDIVRLSFGFADRSGEGEYADHQLPLLTDAVEKVGLEAYRAPCIDPML